jgi:hypothetical protein
MPDELLTNRASRFAYVWQYVIDPARRNDFLAAYGPKGAWVQLFARDNNYYGTVLLSDTANDNRFVTIDYWSSQDARDAFRSVHAVDFLSLDRKCEAYTVTEEFLGDFTIVDSPA